MILAGFVLALSLTPAAALTGTAAKTTATAAQNANAGDTQQKLFTLLKQTPTVAGAIALLASDKTE
jgi:hypothetical protein